MNVGPTPDNPLTVTTTGPLVAPAGTVATISVVLALVKRAFVPLNVTLFSAIVGPKFYQ